MPWKAAPDRRLLETARALFCRDGIHATGIDRILAEASVSKMTLYRSYGSKQGLLRAVLLQEGAEWRAAFFGGLGAGAFSADAVIDALEPWFHGERFYGCAFMNAVAEHAKGEPWLRALTAEHHAAIRTTLTERADAAGFAAPERLARQIMLAIDGAIAAFMMSGDPAVLDLTRRNLRAILASA